MVLLHLPHATMIAMVPPRSDHELEVVHHTDQVEEGTETELVEVDRQEGMIEDMIVRMRIDDQTLTMQT